MVSLVGPASPDIVSTSAMSVPQSATTFWMNFQSPSAGGGEVEVADAGHLVGFKLGLGVLAHLGLDHAALGEGALRKPAALDVRQPGRLQILGLQLVDEQVRVLEQVSDADAVEAGRIREKPVVNEAVEHPHAHRARLGRWDGPWRRR